MQTIKRYTAHSLKWSAFSLAAALTVVLSLGVSSWLSFQLLVLLMQS